MGTQPASSHNTCARSSGKVGRFPGLTLAGVLAKHLGVVDSWPTVQIIRLAILREASLSQVSVAEAAEVILQAAKEITPRPVYRCPSEWELREIYRLNSIDRFWFEDARWRNKDVYLEFRSRLQGRRVSGAEPL